MFWNRKASNQIQKMAQALQFMKFETFSIRSCRQIPWIDQSKNIEEQVASWIGLNFPKFKTDYAATLYEIRRGSKICAAPGNFKGVGNRGIARSYTR